MRLFAPIVMGLALSLAACAAPQPLAVQGQPAASASVAPVGLVTGTVKAPKQLVAAVVPTGGGNVLPTGGGNVVPVGGGNVIPSGGGHLLAVTEAPLANARVFLADAAGQPYPTLAAVTCDDQGRFTFPAVPAGFSYMVVVQAHDTARNKDVTLQTLVKSSELGATTVVDTASSLVTLAVTQGQDSALGQFNAAAFRTATEATAKGLTDGDLPDLSDRAALLAKVDQLAKAVAELQTALDQVRQDLKDIKDSLSQLKAQVDNQAKGPFMPQQPGSLPGQGFMPAGAANGGARPGDCGPPGAFPLVLAKAYEGYPLRVDFVSPYGNLILQLIFTKPGDKPVAHLPTGCPHAITLRDSVGKVLASEASFAIPLGAQGDVALPF